MSKYRNRYRRESKRIQNWNYGWSQPYFVTLCTKNRVHYFGEIKEGEMVLSEIGRIVQTEWERTPLIRPDMNLVLSECVVMPDHFHGVITIGRNPYNKPGTGKGDAMHRVATPVSGRTFGSEAITQPQNKFGPQSKNLASIMRGFKSSVTKQARLINPKFEWQVKYDDKIVDDTPTLKIIDRYIINNPQKWEEDEKG
jgi:REP element-mobilizing transposase RayT